MTESQRVVALEMLICGGNRIVFKRGRVCERMKMNLRRAKKSLIRERRKMENGPR